MVVVSAYAAHHILLLEPKDEPSQGGITAKENAKQPKKYSDSLLYQNLKGR